jgi:hypothetical protein
MYEGDYLELCVPARQLIRSARKDTVSWQVPVRCAAQLSKLRLGEVTFLEHHRSWSVLEVV